MIDAGNHTTVDPTDVALSVVIAAHNAADTIRPQLEALIEQHCDLTWEIVVVDNASTDATRSRVTAIAERCSTVRIVDANDGRGPAYARNVGAQAARGRSLAFCDADDIVGPAWVAAMAEALATRPFVSGPVELARLNPDWLVDSRGSFGTTGVTRFDDRFPFASSCNLGIHRDVFLDLGGFDESLHVGEDIEVSMRLSLRGIELGYVPAAMVHYRYRPTLRSTFERAVAYGAARPVIAELWRRRGGVPVARTRGARNWLWLLRHLPLLRDRTGQARWLWVAGQRLGSLRGSWRVRRPYL